MQTTKDDVLTAIKQMVSQCRDIQKKLADDQQFLVNNDLAGLAASNQQKALLLENLSRQKAAIIASGINRNQPEVNNLLNQLKQELTNCYRSTVTNYQVVFANLMQLKNIWDKVLANQERTDCIYDHTGSLNK